MKPLSVFGIAMAGFALSAPAAYAGTPRDGLNQIDGYGHVATTNAALCAYAPLDLDSVGLDLNLTAASAGVAALDDGAALVTLTTPFRYYGIDAQTLVVSSNGYVAFAGGVADENGGDFSNDPYLPAVPDNTPAASARIYAYHDELGGEGAGARLLHADFANCPRPSGVVGNEACSVVRWKNWTRLGDNDPITVDLLLYHTSAAIVVQFDAIDASAGSSACVGLQSADASDGGAWSCNGGRQLSAASAICFYDPAHLPGGNDVIFGNGFE